MGKFPKRNFQGEPGYFTVEGARLNWATDRFDLERIHEAVASRIARSNNKISHELTLSEAKRRAWLQSAAGLAIWYVSLTALCIVALSVPYHDLMEIASKGYIPGINPFIRSIQMSPFSSIAEWLYVLGSIDPFRLHAPSNVTFALYFFGAAAFCSIGGAVSQAGSKLANQVRLTEEERQRRIWIMQNANVPIADLPKTFVINVSTTDKWYARPKGIVGLMVIGGVLVACLDRLLHLSP